MRNFYIWILFLNLPCVMVTSRPVQEADAGAFSQAYENDSIPKTERDNEEKVISIRITSSVAVGRGKNKPKTLEKQVPESTELSTTVTTQTSSTAGMDWNDGESANEKSSSYDLSGANMEFIKQLNSRKESRGLNRYEDVHGFQSNSRNTNIKESDDSIAEPSIKSVLEIENSDNVPLARSIPHSPSPHNSYIRGLSQKSINENSNNHGLTTVSFDIVHESPKADSFKATANTYLNPSQSFSEPAKFYSEPEKVYNEPAKIYNEPAKVYSQPAKVYSEPARFYSEPAKVYGEPAKVYGEPAKIYSEPAKIYSEPAKFYSQPASLHLPPQGVSNPPAWRFNSQSPDITTTISTTPVTTIPDQSTTNRDQKPEKNYEVDEKISVMTDGKSHGVQDSSSMENCKQENCKVGYVVEGRQYRKYRVEERTPDGFIVGEYGVVRNEDGALRGVRYTADGDTNPRLIYDALMKFLQLK